MNIERILDWQVVVKGLGKTLGSAADVELLRQQFLSETALCLVFDSKTFVLVRYEPEFEELVIIAMKGSNLAGVLPKIAEMAKARGFKSLRAHTQRPGLLRLVQRVLPSASQREIVIGMEL